jgi:APA family basic amino acid/polyamine antiporter
MNDTSRQDPGTQRVIGPFDAFSIVAGSMIGIGIFLSPAIVAQHSAGVWDFLLVWLLGGLISLAGAVACAELGTMLPRAGGDYVFQYEAYGPSVAFASGWVLFAAIFCGSIATMAVGLCTYQLPVLLGIDVSTPLVVLPWGSSITGAELAAMVLVVGLTLLNTLGAAPSARTQTVLTVVPVACFALLALWAIFAGVPIATDPAALPRAGGGGLRDYVAYSGWINIIYVAGEVVEPDRNIPRALFGGTLAITALYLLLCTGFLSVLGLDGVAAAGEVGTRMATVLAGGGGSLLMTVLIALALIASINGTILGGARVAFAMGQRGAIWPRLGEVEERHHVPAGALWLQATLASLLILSGRFEQLYTMVSLAMVVTGTLTVGSVFVLRRSRPDTPRPYRATGYPWVPAAYVGSSLLVVAVMLSEALSGEPGAWYPLLGLGILFIAYALHRWRNPD